MPTRKKLHRDHLAGLRGLAEFAWFLALVAAATATSSYLLDPRGEPLPLLVCIALHLLAWGVALRALKSPSGSRRRSPGGDSPGQWMPRILAASFMVYATVFLCTPFPFPLQPNAQRYFALVDALNNRNPAAAQAVLAHDPDPDFVPGYARSGDLRFQATPLQVAICSGDVPIAAALLDHGASLEAAQQQYARPPDSREPTPDRIDLLPLAARSGNIGMVRLLVSHGALVNEDSSADSLMPSPALWAAVESEQRDVVAYLLDHGANPNTIDPAAVPCDSGDCGPAASQQRTVLQVARANGNSAIVKLLLRHRARG